MQYSIAKEILTQPWHIDASTLQMYAPLAFSSIQGLHFEEEVEKQETKPFHVSQQDPDESDYESESQEKVISVIPIRGPMMKHDTLSGSPGTRSIANRLLDGDNDPSVMGTILLIESGGGAADAVPELTEVIQNAQKPVITWVDGIMASAGMYVGAYTDEIMASRETDSVGSIGTMIMLAGREKVSRDSDNNLYMRVYADESSQKNEEFEKALNELNFSLIKERILNPHNNQFIADMREQRPVTEVQLTGRLYEAGNVVGTLVDSLGSFQDAIDRVVELSRQSSNNNNQQQKTMYEMINTVLAISQLEFQDGYTSLSEDQVQAIETKLQEQNTALEKKTQEQQDARNEADTASQTIADKDQQIEKLQNENKELKEGPGETHQEVYRRNDRNATDDETYQDVLTDDAIALYNQIQKAK